MKIEDTENSERERKRNFNRLTIIMSTSRRKRLNGFCFNGDSVETCFNRDFIIKNNTRPVAWRRVCRVRGDDGRNRFRPQLQARALTAAFPNEKQ